MLTPRPQEVRWLLRLVLLLLLLLVEEEGAELDSQGRPYQAHPSRQLRTGVVDAPAGRVHVEGLRAERHAELLASPAVRQHFGARPQGLLLRQGRQQVGENQGPVVAAHKVPLASAQRQEGEVFAVATTLVVTQSAEEEHQELLVWGLKSKRKGNSNINNTNGGGRGRIGKQFVCLQGVCPYGKGFENQCLQSTIGI